MVNLLIGLLINEMVVMETLYSDMWIVNSQLHLYDSNAFIVS